MFVTLRAKYAGTCRRCGDSFPPGTKIRYGRGRAYHLAADCPAGRTAGEPGRQADRADCDTTPGATSAVSDVFVIGGAEYYRNKRGRCEDAPCCGCCSI